MSIETMIFGTAVNSETQNLPPAQNPDATPSTPKSPNLVSPSNSVPYIVRFAGGAGVPCSVADVLMAVRPRPDATSLLEGALWSPFDPLASPRARDPPEAARPLALELDRATPNAPSLSEWRLPGRSGFAAGEGDVGGSG